MAGYMPNHRNEHNDRRDRCNDHINRRHKKSRGRFAQNDVTRQPAAAGCNHTKDHYAEQIHVFPDRRHRAGERERDRANHFERKNEFIQRRILFPFFPAAHMPGQV